MQSITNAVDALLRGDTLAFSGVGLSAAVALIIALRFLLPAAERDRVKVPLGLLVAHLVFVLLTAASEPDGGPAKGFRIAALLLLLICIGRAGFLLLVDSILVRRLSRPIPKIFRDILEGLVYTGALLVTLRSAGAQLDALLTTSALLTAVIGLSLQDTLGNLFAGLSIQAQHPFEVGDWIQTSEDPTMIGRVIEINWRATKVLTLDDVEILVPNGPLARAPIRNFTKPTPVSRRSLHVVVPFSHPPHQVQRVILDGLALAEGLLASPAPSVVTREFVERGVSYAVRFYIEDFERRELIDSRARDRIWYALRRAGIDIAIPAAEIGMSQLDESARQRERAEALSARESALRQVDFLRMLTEEQRQQLAHHSRERFYAPKEMVIRQGEIGDAFFIVLDGELGVFIGKERDEVEVAKLKAGSFFGEMSTMTGEPRTATIKTLTQAQLLMVDKGAFQHILEASPELAEQISEVLIARREQLDSASSKSEARMLTKRPADERKELLHRIRQFFSL
jgi:small-conductance mechanosensitive channel/CRP-like cAMP-binding protein